MSGWPVTWPEYTDLDPVSGELVLRPAPAAMDCSDCGCVIEEGAPQAVVDREAVCDHCAPEYDVAAVRYRHDARGRGEVVRVPSGLASATPQ